MTQDSHLIDAVRKSGSLAANIDTRMGACPSCESLQELVDAIGEAVALTDR